MELGHILAYLTQSENNFSIQVLQIFLLSICGEIIFWLTFLYETKGDAFFCVTGSHLMQGLLCEEPNKIWPEKVNRNLKEQETIE